MNENSLRWQGRIGGLRGVKYDCPFVYSYDRVRGRYDDGLGAQESRRAAACYLSQLVNGDIAKGKYVTFTGLAAYDIGYEQTNENKRSRQPITLCSKEILAIWS